MIVYDLKCGGGHRFEEWFASSAEYDARAAADGLACPECGDTHVEKALMAPRINGGGAAAEPATPCGLPACSAGGCQMLGG